MSFPLRAFHLFVPFTVITAVVTAQAKVKESSLPLRATKIAESAGQREHLAGQAATRPKDVPGPAPSAPASPFDDGQQVEAEDEAQERAEEAGESPKDDESSHGGQNPSSSTEPEETAPLPAEAPPAETPPAGAAPIGEAAAVQASEAPNPPPPAPKHPAEAVEPFHFITLVHASGRYGGVEEGDNLDQPRPITEGTGVASAGGQVTWGVIPQSSFTMAARLRGGAYFGDGPILAYAGAAVLAGSAFGNKKEDRFSYMLGGLGAEFIPARKEDLLTVHASGGTVFGGFSFGGDIEFAVSPNKGFFMAGLHLGWGHLSR